ncbi:MAG: hypothetical protein MI802_01725 [Desulfobacterales bacterium]|nr:hypothetical protein [Desulfobacterales bacterium]
MYEIKTNTEKNRLYVILGEIETGDGKRFFEEIQVAVKQLSPGFSAVSDIREFSFKDPEEGKWAEKVLPFMADSGMSVVARVTGAITTTAERTEPRFGYRVVMVDTFENADDVLDSLNS